ncbi:uncharacterized protein C8orf88 homolog isoform X2 [Hyla sarda]|uniref:uncharacterized protein C8orf88 homolog isoform X2 n=1 Tax=Hyla sarda TaxID=327740 RepID=UPI0024C25FE7|nr:uncharacterized protein C8orf88 homolog isoform X2 [Hyla sarda]
MFTGCDLLLEMDARRLIRKQLQPARPIRRILPGSGAVFINFQATFTDCRDNFKDHCNMWCSIENLHHVFKDPVIEKPLEEPQWNNKKDRITYTRDFLLQLSNVSVSRKKPKYLPDLPIILQDPISNLYCAIDPFSPADMQNTHLSARLDHRTYHLSQDDALIFG